MHLLGGAVSGGGAGGAADGLLVHGIALLELVEDADLDLGGVAVLGDGADDLDGDAGVGVGVEGLDDLAERALSQQSHDLIYI